MRFSPRNMCVLSAFIAVVLASTALADGEGEVIVDPLPGDITLPAPWPMDLHSQNRAIAFGSLLLARSGSDINQWKAVEAQESCWSSGGVIIEKPSDNDGGANTLPDNDGGPNPLPNPYECNWFVMVTTAYDFVECPDGQAYISRSGEGVEVIDRHTGSSFGWGESSACGDDDFLKANSQLHNKERPLDLKKLRIQRR